jgi:hypothetical protein
MENKTNAVNSLSLQDLYAVDSNLARSLKFILDFEHGSIEEMIGTNFTASSNPLLPLTLGEETDNNTEQKISKELKYIELKSSGGDVYVNRSNRSEFVQLFVRHALYGSCESLVDNFVAGARTLFAGELVDLCSFEEIELLICGTREIGVLTSAITAFKNLITSLLL